jgi:hypothetical protein|uniref:Minor capsid protein P9 transmembrane helices domain-containing protein n=1 Tax=viral metagenome TaxID=1070528 RepID=A0A6C0JQT3_9ZZZZ
MTQPLKSNNYMSDLSLNTQYTIIDNKENDMNCKKKRIVPFWIENPNILLDSRYILEFFPIDTMSYNQKMNAVTRTIIILTILGFVLTQHIRILLIGLLTVGIVYLMHYYHTVEDDKVKMKRSEGFNSGPAHDYLVEKGIAIKNDIFQEPDASNPFSNVLITDYDYNPDKKPAPPSFNENVNAKILKEAKQFVIDANPDQPDIANKLFKDLGEEMVFEQSLRQFNSNPNTTIPNDQSAFAEFCYGSMISCKEGNNFACARNMARHTNY